MSQAKRSHPESRAILRRYMADYTSSSSAPRNIKGGTFAILIRDTGKVWINQCKSFQSTITRFRTNMGQPDCVRAAVARGSALELYLLTQPDRFCVEQLTQELEAADNVADRKKRECQGPGQLYSIRHRRTYDYFVVADRQGIHSSTVLSNFIARLQVMSGKALNKQLDEFVTTHADDILKGVGFDITLIDSFDNREDEWLKRQVYIDDNRYGNNLNYQSVDTPQAA